MNTMPSHRHHRVAVYTIAIALVLDVLLGGLYAYFESIPLWHGLYCALANAVTLGGDVSPHNAAGYVINTMECVTIVPLFAATVSFFTSGLSSTETKKVVDTIKEGTNDSTS